MNEIVYQSAMATIYWGDCLEVLPQLGKVDCVVTDPPYGIRRDKGMGGGGFDSTGRWPRKPREYLGEWDNDAPSKEALNVVVSTAPVAVVWGGNYLPLERGGRWFVWNKEQVMPSYSDAELAWTNLYGESVKMFTLHCNKARLEGGLHPTQKPVALMAWCIQQAKVAPGQTILDPYMGSGTTGVAAVKLGCKFIGIECECKYVDIAIRRIKAAEEQQPLFEQPKIEDEQPEMFRD